MFNDAVRKCIVLASFADIHMVMNLIMHFMNLTVTCHDVQSQLFSVLFILLFAIKLNFLTLYTEKRNFYFLLFILNVLFCQINHICIDFSVINRKLISWGFFLIHILNHINTVTRLEFNNSVNIQH